MGGKDSDSYLPIGDDEHIVPSKKEKFKKFLKFLGPGFVMSIAYVDPGNIESDLQAGAQGGYSLLWVLLWSTIVGGVFQILAARLGVVTGRHLSEVCHDEYPTVPRILLWIMTELAIIGSDIQEVIGSAIAIQMLTNGWIPVYAGVIITAADTFSFLLIDNYGSRRLELFFVVLIAVMGISFGVEYIISSPDQLQVLEGVIVPKLNNRKLITQAVGMFGAVIMPHNLFLHSALVQSRKLDTPTRACVREANLFYAIESVIALFFSFLINLFVISVFAKGFYGRTDIDTDAIGLHNAGDQLAKEYGNVAYYIWAIGLLASGQSSTMTGTYTGQFVMSGFLNLHLPKWKRVLITRSVAIMPAILVAIFAKAWLDQLDELLNVWQSILLPFAVMPLIGFTSKERLMGPFVNSITTSACLISLGLVLLSMNFYLVWVYIDEFLPATWWVYLIVSFFCLVYLISLLYLSTGPNIFTRIYNKITCKEQEVEQLEIIETHDNQHQPLLSRTVS